MCGTLLIRVVLLAAPAVLLAGCGGDNPLGRKALSGNVTLDGQPVASGSIDFQPMQSGGVSSGGPIENGRYSIRTVEGLPVGKYRVQIYASDPSIGKLPAGGMPGDDVAVAPELIPPEWNVNSQQTIEVTDSGPNTFDFAVTTKK